MPSAAVVGGGPVGCLAALGLAHRGFAVTIYESRPAPISSSNGSAAGPSGSTARARSINLAISTRGISGLRAVAPALPGKMDLADMVLDGAVPMRARMIHTGHEQNSQAYSADGECINSVSRTHLNDLLLQQAESHPSVTVCYGHRLKRADFDKGEKARKGKAPADAEGECELMFGVDGQESPSVVSADLVLGCDGINSAVRDQLARTISFDFARSYIDSLYVELSMPAKLDAAGQLDFALDPHHLHIWPRHDYMLIALPNPDHTFTCTLFAPAGIFEEHLSGREKTLAFFEDKFPDALPLMGRDAVARDIAERRPSPLASVRCRPYHYKGRVLLLGDSSHAMLPFYGQGLNCGFEDVRVLLELIDRHAEEEEMPRPTAPAPTSRTHSRSDSGVSMSSRAPSPRALKPHAVSGAHPSTQALERALAEYSATRHDDLVAICDLAQNNYYEMCSRVVSRTYLLRKHFDTLLMRVLPAGWWSSLYAMVTFSNLGYAAVMRREERQRRIVSNVAIASGVGLAAAAGVGLARASRFWAQRA